MNCPHCGKALAIVKAVPTTSTTTPTTINTDTHWQPVRRTVTCNRCGATELAWLKGRNGKPYLAIARRLPDGRLGADRREFHRCGADPALDRTMITAEDIAF
jgi:predicted nucleic-acid-binding Zn-ribbon protein